MNFPLEYVINPINPVVGNGSVVGDDSLVGNSSVVGNDVTEAADMEILPPSPSCEQSLFQSGF